MLSARHKGLRLLSEIKQCIESLGYQCSIEHVNGYERLFINLVLADFDIQLMLASQPPFFGLPEFVLVNPEQFGRIAHITCFHYGARKFGAICVNAPDSLSINFDKPLLVVQESLSRHISLLEKCLMDKNFNNDELLREFYSDWQRIFPSNNTKPLLANIEQPTLQRLTVYNPVKGQKYGIESHLLVEPSDIHFSDISDMNLSIAKGNRESAGKAIVIPIAQLSPSPSTPDCLNQWYLDTILALPSNLKNELQRKFGQWRDTNYWIVFTANTVGNDRTWFALKLTAKSKKVLPLSGKTLQNWNLEALPIQLLNQENTVKRGGGKLSLADKKVAVIGVGSVGSEIAHKLCAAGVRNLTLVDPDIYEANNLYRHILGQHWIGAPKSLAVSIVLERQFPWSRAEAEMKPLMDFAQNSNLESYDLIVVAIGNPTQERVFKKFLVDNAIEVDVISTWLEGFGVGGHAVLDISDSRGCLLCAYVCQESRGRGLVSNLNFIEPNQVTMKSIAGCGEQFISYGAATSAQTGVMAANLAIQYLEKKQTESCKVSWKGDDDDCFSEGIKLTHRYYNFSKSLVRLPLLDEDCDVCNY